jgi:hypothetical protein
MASKDPDLYTALAATLNIYKDGISFQQKTSWLCRTHHQKLLRVQHLKNAAIWGLKWRQLERP